MDDQQTFRTPRERRFYRRLRDRVKHWAERRDIPEKRLEYLLVAPDLFVLLSRLTLDERVPLWAKAKVAAGIAYFVTPLDMVPDFLGPPGYLDDVIVAAWILQSMVVELNQLDPAILEEHWEGQMDILEQITHIIDRAEDVLGRGLRFVMRRLHHKNDERSDTRHENDKRSDTRHENDKRSDIRHENDKRSDIRSGKGIGRKQ